MGEPVMARHRTSSCLGVAVAALLLGACASSAPPERPTSALGDDAVTVASFDFPESELLAELYGQALRAAGYDVDLVPDAGPRELVGPALARGVVELVPEYAGTAVQFLSLGDVDGSPDAAANRAALEATLAPRDLVALEPAPAQDRNTFVVTEATAERYDLRDLSDLRGQDRRLRLGGPPECRTRPLCLPGLRDRYDLRFAEFVTLDAGGPLTVQALEQGHVDVALLFTTHPEVGAGLVALRDDRSLQPAENVTPVLHREALRHFGPELAAPLDQVSARLTTRALRSLNGRVADGRPAADVAAAWLAAEGLA
jgi:osmoprotectant transport system substrate-binding protein